MNQEGWSDVEAVEKWISRGLEAGFCGCMWMLRLELFRRVCE